MVPSNCSREATRARTRRRARSRQLRCSNRSASCRWNWSVYKNSGALTSKNFASWSIQATLSSASDAAVNCSVYPDRRMTTGRTKGCLELDVDVSADADDQRFGHPALAAQGCHQHINLAGGEASHVGLHHHSLEV